MFNSVSVNSTDDTCGLELNKLKIKKINPFKMDIFNGRCNNNIAIHNYHYYGVSRLKRSKNMKYVFVVAPIQHSIEIFVLVFLLIKPIIDVNINSCSTNSQSRFRFLRNIKLHQLSCAYKNVLLVCFSFLEEDLL